MSMFPPDEPPQRNADDMGYPPSPAPEPEKVVTHARFVGRSPDAPAPQPFDIEQLRRVGLVTTETADAIDGLNLREPQFGEVVVGQLTPDEAAQYVALHNASQERTKIERRVGGDFLMRAGEKIKASTDDDLAVNPEDVVTEDEAVSLFRSQRKAESLKAILYWQISERLGYHDWFLSVRSKSRIVRLNRKW
jgi:hypothetical protein